MKIGYEIVAFPTVTCRETYDTWTITLNSIVREKSDMKTMTVTACQTSQFRVTLTTVFFSTLMFSVGSCDTSKAEEIIVGPQIKIRVQVRNPEGEPVVGAVVRPSGLRTRAQPTNHSGWAESRHGKLPLVKTDEDGIAEVLCPKFVVEKVETGKITWLVDHEDYIVFREDRSVDDAPAEIVLQSGRRIVIGAVHAKTGVAITENLHASLGDGGFAFKEWNLTSSGMLMSRAVDMNRRMMRVFHVPSDGPVLFSAPIDLEKHGDKSGVLIRNVKLQSGTRIEGMIDKSVPRPVMNGTVVVTVVEGVELEIWEARDSWGDWTKINADGSFVFDSLPRGSVVQMIAVCDGFVSALPTEDEIKNVGFDSKTLQNRSSLVIPQVARLKGDRISPTIRMEQTAICRVRVLDPEGQPLEGASVMMFPNQYWLGRGSQIVGSGSSIRPFLLLKKEMGEQIWDWANWKKLQELGVSSSAGDRYMVKTNTEGIAEVKTVPGGSEDKPRSESVYVQHDRFDQPADGFGGLRRRISVKLIRGKTTEITIKMEKKGTNVLGE